MKIFHLEEPEEKGEFLSTSQGGREKKKKNYTFQSTHIRSLRRNLELDFDGDDSSILENTGEKKKNKNKNK